MTDHNSVQPHPAIQIEWAGGMHFDAGRLGGPRVRIDGDAESGPGPFDVLLGALAACASTDVVEILQKQRTPVQSLKVRVDATRVAGTPRRLASAALQFTIGATGITQEKAERAVELAVTKYCSVRSSLIADARVTWTIDLQS